MIIRRLSAISSLQKKKDRTPQSTVSGNLLIEKDWLQGPKHKGMLIELYRTHLYHHLGEMAVSVNCLEISKSKVPETKY